MCSFFVHACGITLRITFLVDINTGCTVFTVAAFAGLRFHFAFPCFARIFYFEHP